MEEDWPFTEVDPSEILWRYMTWKKFEDLLRTSALYFSRPDRFDDARRWVERACELGGKEMKQRVLDGPKLEKVWRS